MLNRKEKDVKKHLIEDNFEFSNQDKEDILNTIKSKINLEVEEKPSFKERFNLKVVYALVCSLVICIVGYLGIKMINNNYINPEYKGKDVESLNLKEGEYCLAYIKYFDYNQYENLISNKNIDFVFRKDLNGYIISKEEKLTLIIGNYYFSMDLFLELSAFDIIDKYNLEYKTSFNEVNLNDNNSGLLFLIKENGIEFYTRKNNEKLSIFVEFA